MRGLLRRYPALDLIRAQDAGLIGKHDLVIFEWAAKDRRLVLTHDFATMIGFAYSRIAEGLEMPGVIAVPQSLPIGEIIDELSVLIEGSLENEWENQVIFIPLK